jgi:hypothetical protein
VLGTVRESALVPERKTLRIERRVRHRANARWDGSMRVNVWGSLCVNTCVKWCRLALYLY